MENIRLYSITLFLDKNRMEHTREAYDVTDLIGDLGGVLEVMISFIGIFLFSISRHSFSLKILEKLFLARSNDKKIFSVAKISKAD